MATVATHCSTATASKLSTDEASSDPLQAPISYVLLELTSLEEASSTIGCSKNRVS